MKGEGVEDVWIGTGGREGGREKGREGEKEEGRTGGREGEKKEGREGVRAGDILAVFISYSPHSDCDGLKQSVAKRPRERSQEEKEGKPLQLLDP